MREQYKKQGLAVAAISYDSCEILHNFAERVGITFPLLSDPGSAIIKAFGILNTNFFPGQEGYGIPFPGTYIVDGHGRVKAKYFEQNHRERYSPTTVLTKEYGIATGQRMKIRADHLTVTAYASQRVAEPGNRVTLVLEVDIPPNIHVYAPGVQGYTPASFSIDETPFLRAHNPEFPKPEILRLPLIKERVPVYHGSIRIMRDVTISSQLKDSKLEISGTFQYQACDDRVCYFPAKIPLPFALQIQPNDRQRVPPALRREP